MSLGFHSVADAFLDGFGREHLDDSLRYLAIRLGCLTAGLVIIDQQGSRTVSAIGAKVLATYRPAGRAKLEDLRFPIVSNRPDELAALSVHFPFAAGSRNLLAAPVIGLGPNQLLIVVCAFFKVESDLKSASDDMYQFLPLLKSQVRLLTELAETAKECPVSTYFAAGAREPINPYNAKDSENHEVVSDFLLSTLIRRRSMRARRDLVYFGVRNWRSPLKSYQIAALRAIKRNPPETFLRAVATEVADEAARLVGRNAFQSVTAVPCGHSRPDGFSHQLGRHVARHLGLPFADAFAYRSISGSSHPKTNLSRPPMKLISAPVGHTLLVDDVATSGSHIAEAGTLLRRAGINVTPIAWISA
ncbi:hypothetical protein [Thermaurantiacus tibetensis]|uniref:hypothetical protein n=1 Tax=Thermaurantiacus tibetensis TaxID=2759035 RepID=UPI0018902002|nr:hypothetical protein [Thermaurantiacus tibetensis]